MRVDRATGTRTCRRRIAAFAVLGSLAVLGLTGCTLPPGFKNVPLPGTKDGGGGSIGDKNSPRPHVVAPSATTPASADSQSAAPSTTVSPDASPVASPQPGSKPDAGTATTAPATAPKVSAAPAEQEPTKTTPTPDPQPPVPAPKGPGQTPPGGDKGETGNMVATPKG